MHGIDVLRDKRGRGIEMKGAGVRYVFGMDGRRVGGERGVGYCGCERGGLKGW